MPSPISEINGLQIAAIQATNADTASYVPSSGVDGPLGLDSISTSATASYIDPAFISASAAASGFGSGGGSSTAATASLALTVSQSQAANSLHRVALLDTAGGDSPTPVYFDHNGIVYDAGTNALSVYGPVTASSGFYGTASWAVTASYALSSAGGSNQTLLEKAAAGYEYYNDFLSTPTLTGTSDGQGYIFLFSGTGASMVSSTSPGVRASNQHGFIRPTTGTQTTGYAGFYGGSSGNQFIVGGGAMSFKVSALFNTLSTSVERYRSTIGYGDQATSTAEVNGIFFTYDEGGVWNGTTASPNWQCVTAASSVRTLTTTSVAVSTTAWHKLNIEINADGTSVGFYIDDVLVATHTTNIPSGSARPITPKSQIVKTAGTTSRFFHIDYLYYSQTYTTPKSL